MHAHRARPRLLILVGLVATLAVLGACGDDDDGGNQDNADADPGQGSDGSASEFAPAGLMSTSLELREGAVVTNTWVFGAGSGTSGTAMLVGVDSFAFTYTKTASTTATLTFEVGGTDKYEMVWTSATAGTFMESFDNVPGNPGTFSVTAN